MDGCTTTTLTNRDKQGRETVATLVYCPRFIPQAEAEQFFVRIVQGTQWDEMYERGEPYNTIIRNARLMKWYSSLPEATYPFSNSSIGGVTLASGEYHPRGLAPNAWTPDLLAIRRLLVEKLNRDNEGQAPVAEDHYNSVLVNYYRDGKDSVAMHNDRDPWLGVDFDVQSVSLGGARDFVVSANNSPSSYTTVLESGSLMQMAGMAQNGFRHGVPAVKSTHPAYRKGRVNLTFRRVIPELMERQPRGVTLEAFKLTLPQKYDSVWTEAEREAIEASRSPAEIYRQLKPIDARKRVAKRARED